MRGYFLAALASVALAACAGSEPAPGRAAHGDATGDATHDVIVRGGMIYDGTGGEPFRADVAIDGDRITAIGDLGTTRGHKEVDANGLAVAPGFINMLSWANASLIEDGRAQSDIR